jgi:TetR/AcrR family transcriptional regulator, fatty acid metabolism regulator protein
MPPSRQVPQIKPLSNLKAKMINHQNKKEFEPKETDKRARILEAARSILSAKRYDDVPVSEIVEAAGVAKGTFYLYFPSKAELIAVIAEGLQLEIRAAIFSVMDDNQPILEVIQAIIWSVYKISQQHRDLMHILEMDLLLGGIERHKSEQDQQIKSMILMLQGARERNEIDANLDLQITAELISGVMMPLSRAIIFGQSDIAPERYIAETVSFLRRALGVTSTQNLT